MTAIDQSKISMTSMIQCRYSLSKRKQEVPAMKLGFVSAILPEFTLDQVLSFAHKGASRASS